MTRRTAVLLQTHFFDATIARMFRRLQETCPPHYSCFVLMHRPPDSAVPARLREFPHHFVTTPEVRNPAYGGKSNGPNWNFVVDGHSDLVWLHFFNAHPEFERFWGVEYDVRFSGPWHRLFGAFDDNDADFLTTSLRTQSTDPHWPMWATLRSPDGELPPGDECIKGFTPIWRASAAAMRAMDAAYRDGWTGHCEVTWPTLIRKADLSIEDLGDNGPFVRSANRGRFYSNNSSTWDYSPGTFTFKPAKHVFGLRRNRLYHPVKPLGTTLREDVGRVQAKLRNASRRVRDGMTRIYGHRTLNP